MKSPKILCAGFFWIMLQTGPVTGAGTAPARFLLDQDMEDYEAGNSVGSIVSQGQTVWVGASDLSRTDNDGESWTNINRGRGIGLGGIGAIAVRNDVIWISTILDSTTDLGTFDTGGGVGYSTDGGLTWTWFPQPVDSVDETRYKPTTTPIQNPTYDIALTPSEVWIASWAGGLRRSRDNGQTWQVITVDGLAFDALGQLTHRAFSIVADGDILWAGTAGGVHKSSDSGESWITFNHQNQDESISGNFVVALGVQDTPDRHIIWAATVEALGEDEFRAVSKTEDGGLTWQTMLHGEFAHNFAFDDSVVYVTTDRGLYKSIDYGDTWAVFPQIRDDRQDREMYTTKIYSALVDEGGALWVGGADGLARTADNGLTWTVFRSFPVTEQDGEPGTYAYPNPFSPMRHNLYDGDGYVRFQYHVSQETEVSLKVYDFGMNLVTTVAEGMVRSPGDYAEVWNGRNDVGDMVANGVYFYQISMRGRDPLWGKVMVVN